MGIITDNKLITILQNIFKQNSYAISLYLRKIASTLVIFIIARILTVGDYGLYSSYNTITLFLLLFASAGIEQYVLVSSNNKLKKVKRKLNFFLFYAVSVLTLLIIFSQLAPLENHFIFTLIIIRNFFDSTFFTLILPYFQSGKLLYQIAKINTYYSMGIMLIAILTFIFKLSLINYLYLNIILGLINYIQCNKFIKISYKKAIKGFKRFIKTIDKSFKYYFTTTITITLYYQMTALLISSLLTKEDVATYFAAFNIASLINIFVTAQQQQILPNLIDKTKAELINTIKNSCKFILLINIALFFFFLIFGNKLLVLIYGNAFYQNAHKILIILCIATTIYSVAGILGLFITSQNLQKIKFKIQIETIIFSLITCFICYRYGILGLAIAQIFNYLYIFMRYLYSTIKHLKSL